MGIILKRKGRKWEWLLCFSFFITIPLYFVLDGNNKFWGFIPAGTNLLIFIAVVVGICCLYLLLQLVINTYSAIVLSFWLALLFLFFKLFREKLILLIQLSALQQYRYLIPFLLVITTLLFLVLRMVSVETKKQLTAYLNVLFIILVLTEIGYVIENSISDQSTEFTANRLELKKIDQDKKPNIYFFILDEYVGSSTLKNHFGFNNKVFDSALRERSFLVPLTPNSNYNYTPFSILSILNMDYIKGYDKKDLYSGLAVNKCVKSIEHNLLASFFAKNDYRIINNSFFRIGNESYIPKLFLPTEERILLDKTFGSVLWNDLLCTVHSNRFHFLIRDGIARIEMYNRAVYEKTVQNIKKGNVSHFMYSHFMMPHFPYLRTKDGKLRDLGQVHKESNETRNIKSYVEYLQYCNSMVVDLIDKISDKDPGAIVVIASDHGIRGAPTGDRFFNEFNNLLAVRVADKNYDGFTDKMGMVNVFRCILRNQFRQEIPLLENKMINVNPGLHIKAIN